MNLYLKRMVFGVVWLAFITVCAAASTQKPQSGLGGGYFWPKFPAPKKIVVLSSMYDYPKLSAADEGGRFGDMTNTMESVAGLSALAVKEKRYDTMVWIGMGKGSDDYQKYLNKAIESAHAKIVNVADPLTIIPKMANRGIIKGYIVYRKDPSKREMYDLNPANMTGYNNSINAATGLAHVLRGIIVEVHDVAVFQTMGLKCLADVSDKDEEWFFENYKDKCNPNLICAIEPKKPDNRGYAVATRSIVVFGYEKYVGRIYAWAAPNSPVIGWGGGDEDKNTTLVSRNGLYNTASNWGTNFQVIDTVRAGKDISWKQLALNTPLDPLSLKWKQDVHYTTYIMSDGDNICWEMGGFHPWWDNPARGHYPFGWSISATALADCSPVTLEWIASSKRPNDAVIGGGINCYFYPDVYAKDRPNRSEVLADQCRRSDAVMAKLGVATAFMNNLIDWKSADAIEAYKIMAANMPHLKGLFVFQYTPYNAGKGEIIWVTNKQGEPIPIVSCRYCLWNHASQFDMNGPPAKVAEWVSQAPHTGPITSNDYVDWVIVHAWSYFRKADTSTDLWAEECDQTDAAGVRGYTPVVWSMERLPSYVQLVKPDELLWQAKLHLKTRETLVYIAGQLALDPNVSEADHNAISAYKTWLVKTPLDDESSKKEAFEKLVAIKNKME